MASEHVQTVTDSTFDQMVKSSIPVLVDFWAEWCMPCRRIAPAVDKLAAEFAGRLTVAKMNVDENPNVPMKYGIRGIPTLMVFKDGELVDQFVGADESGIKKMVEKHV